MKQILANMTLVIVLGFVAVSYVVADGVKCDPDAAMQIKLAAREIRRYVYLRTGELLPLGNSVNGKVIVLKVDPALEAQQYRLKSENENMLVISGGSPLAVLYGAYAFAEKLGVRFQMDGDILPDQKIAFALPGLDETRKPLFALRGINPFHDFPEGPDWWNADDYKAYSSQLTKMKMNFIGLHCYPLYRPWKHVNPEPGVWIGLPEDVDAQGNVKLSYTASWANTARPGHDCRVAWGCAPLKTSGYRFGAADLFDTEDYGADEMRGLCPWPQTPEQRNELFNRTGRLFNDVFSFARKTGVKSCAGIETPFWIPDELSAKLKAAGRNPEDAAVIREVYKGIYQRIMRAHPLDYFWIWTPERELDPVKTQADLQMAYDVAKEMKAPFGMAACGWGWIAQNFEKLDKTLPKDFALSCINDELGFGSVTTNFTVLQGREHWAIPWLEDDPAMTVAQLWVGRIRKDAADALRFGCNGLMGIHWRTRIIGPNLAALVEAGWSQKGWNPGGAYVPDQKYFNEGRFEDYPDSRITGTEDPRTYQTIRFGENMSYLIPVPDGIYNITLQFCELLHNEAGKRIFNVLINGQKVMDRFDGFAEAGKNKAIDRIFKDVKISGGKLAISFEKQVDVPYIAGIIISRQVQADVAAKSWSLKVDCGGERETMTVSAARQLPTEDFYADWCRAHFGSDAGAAAAKWFCKYDGNLPRWHVRWAGNGPGAVGLPDPRPWNEIAKEYECVDEFEALRPLVSGAGNLERFDYWLDQLRFMRAMAKVCHTLARKDQSSLVKDWTDMMTLLLQTVSTPGEIGTVANLEQHSRVGLKMLGDKDASLPTSYAGKARLVVPTVRSVVEKGEVLKLRLITLSSKPCSSVTVHMRRLGKGEWLDVPAKHIARGVYEAKLPASADDFEYNVGAEVAGGGKLIWPATAPAINQTVIVLEQ